jgi:hypothetical protein
MSLKTEETTPIPEVGLNACFVIMPFRGYYDGYYREIYIPAIQDAGLHPLRGDSIFRPGSIVQQIWDFTKQAKVMLADLSQRNPNVFYELGLAHAISKPVVLVTDNIDDIPFDLRALRTIEYDTRQAKWGDLLQSQITAAILEVLENPTAAIPAAFLEVSETAAPLEVSSIEQRLVNLEQQVTYLSKSGGTIDLVSRFSFPPGTTIGAIAEVIRANLRAGLPKEAIRIALQNNGFEEGTINLGFMFAEAGNFTSKED